MPANRLPASVHALLTKLWPWRDVTYVHSVGPPRYDYEPVRHRFWRTQKYRDRVFKFEHVRALVDQGVINTVADDGDVIDVDAQELSAFLFFLAEVSFAWRNYQKHIREYREYRDGSVKLQGRLDAERKRRTAQIAKMERNISNFEKRH